MWPFLQPPSSAHKRRRIDCHVSELHCTYNTFWAAVRWPRASDALGRRRPRERISKARSVNEKTRARVLARSDRLNLNVAYKAPLPAERFDAPGTLRFASWPLGFLFHFQWSTTLLLCTLLFSLLLASTLLLPLPLLLLLSLLLLTTSLLAPPRPTTTLTTR